MSGDSHTIVLNEGYSTDRASSFTTRQRKSGKEYTSITVSGEALVHDLDPQRLGQPVADALAAAIRDGIERISQRASDATIRARQLAAKAFAEGTQAARDRYGGGRMGALPPNQSDRLFNDSGRLVKSIVARATSAGNWVVNVASNRLNDERFRAQLASLVPEIADPRRLLDSLGVQRALRQGMAGMIQKQQAAISELREARTRAVVGLLRLVG